MKAVIIMGSTSDQGHADKITSVLDEFGVGHEVHAASAHKNPERVLEIIRSFMISQAKKSQQNQHSDIPTSLPPTFRNDSYPGNFSLIHCVLQKRARLARSRGPKDEET